MKGKSSNKKSTKSPRSKADFKEEKLYESIIFMMSNYQTSVIQHQPVVLKFKKSHPAVIMHGLRIYKGMKDSPWFSGIPGIDDLLENYLTLIKNYREAQGKVRTRTLGTRAARDVIASQFRVYSDNLRFVVEGVCLMNHDDSPAIALSAAMKLHAPSAGRGRQNWRVKKGKVEGSIVLQGVVPDTKSKRYCFQWQKTFTPNITGSWYFEENEIIPSLAGEKTVLNLPIQQRVFLRYRVILPGDECTDWSNVISIIVT